MTGWSLFCLQHISALANTCSVHLPPPPPFAPHTCSPFVTAHPTGTNTPLVCDCVQGLDDHAHKPTLQRLPKHIQIVGSPAAAAVAESLGFTDVISLDHGKTVQTCNGRLTITATAGKFHFTSQPISMVSNLGQQTLPLGRMLT